MNILLVEDCEDIRDHLGTFLIGIGHSVVLASGSKEALSHLSNAKFDAILTDIEMPDGSGMVLLQQIRSQNDKTPVLVMTGSSTVAEVEVIAIGGNAFIRKPLNLEKIKELLTLIEAHLDATAK